MRRPGEVTEPLEHQRCEQLLRVHLFEHGEMHPMSTKQESPFFRQVLLCGVSPLKDSGFFDPHKIQTGVEPRYFCFIPPPSQRKTVAEVFIF